jgi:uncharacterized protein YggE
MNSLKTILLGVLIFATSLVSIAQTENKTRIINMTGNAELDAKPDQIFVNVTLQEYNGSSQIDAIEENFLESAYKLGFEKQDVKVKNVYGYQSWNNRKREGFRASKTYTIFLRDDKKLNRLLESLDDKSVTNIYTEKMESSREKEIESELRKLAIKDAMEKAMDYLSVTNDKLGPLLMLNEQSYNAPMYNRMEAMSMDKSSGSMTSPDFNDVTYKASVNVQFEIISQ